MPLILRPWQLLALPYLEWLLDEGARGSGRSTIIAVAMVRMAARHPGQRIIFWDHFPSHHSAQYVRDQMLVLIREDPLLRQHYTSTTRSFQINLPVAIENWLPEMEENLENITDGFPSVLQSLESHPDRSLAVADPKDPGPSVLDRILADKGD